VRSAKRLPEGRIRAPSCALHGRFLGTCNGVASRQRQLVRSAERPPEGRIRAPCCALHGRFLYRHSLSAKCLVSLFSVSRMPSIVVLCPPSALYRHSLSAKLLVSSFSLRQAACVGILSPPSALYRRSLSSKCFALYRHCQVLCIVFLSPPSALNRHSLSAKRFVCALLIVIDTFFDVSRHWKP
jgi:hypothetical protein